MTNNNVISFANRRTNAAIAAIEQMQAAEVSAANSYASIEHERLHAARVEARAERMRSAFKLVSN